MPIPGVLHASSNQIVRVAMVGAASLVLPDLYLLWQRNVANASHRLCCGPGVVPDGNHLALHVDVVDRSCVAIAKL